MTFAGDDNNSFRSLKPEGDSSRPHEYQFMLVDFCCQPAPPVLQRKSSLQLLKSAALLPVRPGEESAGLSFIR
jgi:hypothetical protein